MIALLALFACGGHRDPADPVTPVTPDPSAEAPIPPKQCLHRWQLPKGESVLHEQRRLGTPWPDFSTAYPAITVDSTMTPVATVADIQLDGAPVLWFSADHSMVHADARAFSTLTAVDVPGVTAGTSVTVGTIAPEALAKLGGRAVVDLLLRSDTLRTYWHIGSELCLETERTEDGWRGNFSGEHTYFTNSENHDEMWFTVTIAPDGVIVITGANANFAG